MEHAILDSLEHLMTSWWVYAALLGICALDALIPVFPSEAPVILAGVYAASDPHGPNLVLVIAAAGLGALLGDHLSYGVGHLALGRRLLSGEGRRRKVVRQVETILHTRGSWALLVARFIPGGRSVATLSLGATRYPLRSKFTPYDLLACTIWALHGSVIGYLGGRAFKDDPLAGIVTGLGLAMAVTGLLEWRRYRAEKKRARAREVEATVTSPDGDQNPDRANDLTPTR